ncbi:MAG: hypothetical protein GTO33_04510, partial [Acidobacteria bacterium]|nr:hypothetical protein [Acidobacteriota bacterium]
PMIAKLVVAGTDRAGTIDALRDALDRLLIGGVVTNTGFHRWLVDQESYLAARVTTRFVDEATLPRRDDDAALAVAAHAWWDHGDAAGAALGEPWAALRDARFTPHLLRRTLGLRDHDGTQHEVVRSDTTPRDSGSLSIDSRRGLVVVNLEGHSHTFRVVDRIERWSRTGSASTIPADALVAPFPAGVTEIHVSPGDHVAAGDVLVVIEAMKMLHSLPADGAGTVAAVHVAVGDQVATNQVLITFEGPAKGTEPE